MARRVLPVGLCRLCMREKELTFEHFPPKSANNAVPVQAIDTSSILSRPRQYNEIRLGRKDQRGFGANVFCRDCNTYLSMYARHYGEVAREAQRKLKSSYKRASFAANPLTAVLDYRCLWPGTLARGALALFVGSTDPASLVNLEPARNMLRNPKDTSAAGSMRLYLGLTEGQIVRSSGPLWEYRPGIGLSVSLHFSFPPFHWTLLPEGGVLDSRWAADVTAMLGFAHKQTSSLLLHSMVWKSDLLVLPPALRKR